MLKSNLRRDPDVSLGAVFDEFRIYDDLILATEETSMEHKVQKSSDEPSSSVTQPPESKTIINFLLLTSLIGTLIWLGRAIFLIYSERDVSAAWSLIGLGLSVLGVSLFISIAINTFRSRATTYFALISDVLRGTSIVLGTVIWLGIGLYCILLSMIGE